MLPVTSSVSYNNIHDRFKRGRGFAKTSKIRKTQTNFEAIKFVLQRVFTLLEKVWLNIWANIIFHKEAGKKFAVVIHGAETLCLGSANKSSANEILGLHANDRDGQ